MTRSHGLVMAALCVAASLCAACPAQDKGAPGGSAVVLEQDASADKSADATSESEAVAPEQARWATLTKPPAPSVKPGALGEDEQAAVKALLVEVPDKLGHALTALHAYGPGIEPEVLKLLDDPDGGRRALGVKLVGNLRLKGAMGKVAQMLADPDARVRRMALQTVGKHGEPDHKARLDKVTASPEVASWMRASRYAARAGSRNIVSTLRQRAQNENRVYRLRALEGLAEVALPQDVGWYQKVLEEDAPTSYNEALAVWRGLTQADPEVAWRSFDQRRRAKDARMEARVYDAVLAIVAPHVPAEVVIKEAQERLSARYEPRLGTLASALALTPGPEVDAEITKLLTRKLYTCEVVGAWLEREARLTRQAALFERVAADPAAVGEDAKAIAERLEQVRKSLDVLRPRIELGALKLTERLKRGGDACTGNITELTEARGESLLKPLLGAEEPSARQGALTLLARHGQWAHVPEIMKLYFDVNEQVRGESRAALRAILGHAMRLPGGFIWETWYAHTFGPVPPATFPAQDIDATRAADYERSLLKRPPAREPVSAPQAPRRPGIIKVPDNTK